MNPQYRFKLSIYDEQTGEEVAFIDEPMMSQDSSEESHRISDNQPYYMRLMRSFHREREAFEQTHYEKDEKYAE